MFQYPTKRSVVQVSWHLQDKCVCQFSSTEWHLQTRFSSVHPSGSASHPDISGNVNSEVTWHFLGRKSGVTNMIYFYKLRYKRKKQRLSIRLSMVSIHPLHLSNIHPDISGKVDFGEVVGANHGDPRHQHIHCVHKPETLRESEWSERVSEWSEWVSGWTRVRGRKNVMCDTSFLSAQESRLKVGAAYPATHTQKTISSASCDVRA